MAAHNSLDIMEISSTNNISKHSRCLERTRQSISFQVDSQVEDSWTGNGINSFECFPLTDAERSAAKEVIIMMEFKPWEKA